MRKLIWPIHQNELKKFVPTFFIFFLLAFVYDLLRILKSSVIVAESVVGAEVIPFLKVWAVIPGAFILTGLAIRLSHRFNREKVFYLMLSFFIVFYTIFVAFIYPQRESLAATGLAFKMQQYLPSGAQGLISMVSNWPLSLFYVVTELWGSILLSMLIWGFANEITTVEEASRFYPLFLLGANSAAIFAGLGSGYFANKAFDPSLPFGLNAWDQAFVFYLCTAIVSGILVMALFYYMHLQGVVEPCDSPEQRAGKAPRVKLSLRESFNCLFKSKHLLYIALLVLCYNLVFNLTDVLWENQVKELYQDDTAGMASYKSLITTLTGVLSVLISLFVTGNILRKVGWKYAAGATPFVIFISGLGFFAFLIFQPDISFGDLFFGLAADPLQATLLLGSVQVVCARGCKYTLFDTAKEIAFIPLSTHEKRLGKAAIDGVGSRIGKSAGSLLVQVLLLVCQSISAATPIIALTIVLILCVWGYAVSGLSKQLR